MALARVVIFEGVGRDRVDQMRQDVASGERPQDLPATEMMLLFDEEAERAVAIVFFDDDAAYAQGDAVLSAMPAMDTPGRRTSVIKYEVALRVTA
jgi:hypothetical protein